MVHRRGQVVHPPTTHSGECLAPCSSLAIDFPGGDCYTLNVGAEWYLAPLPAPGPPSDILPHFQVVPFFKFTTAPALLLAFSSALLYIVAPQVPLLSPSTEPLSLIALFMGPSYLVSSLSEPALSPSLLCRDQLVKMLSWKPMIPQLLIHCPL